MTAEGLHERGEAVGNLVVLGPQRLGQQELPEIGPEFDDTRRLVLGPSVQMLAGADNGLEGVARAEVVAPRK